MEDKNINKAPESAEPLSRGGEWVVDAGEIMEGVFDEDSAQEAAEAETMQPGGGAQPEEGFTLKHLDEVRTVDRDGVIELAQKGLDYDRVRSKLESARDELAEIKEWMGEVSGGKAPEEFRRELSAKALAEREGIEFSEALERVKPLHQGRTGANEATSGAQRAKREVREFFARHPDAAARMAVDRGAIPDEVWRRVRAGEGLSAAYEAVQLRSDAEAKSERVRELERELAETRQARRNALRATGSVGSDGGDAPRDMADIGWNAV